MHKRVVVGGPDECWEWSGARLPKGYGILTARGLRLYAHREAWVEANGRPVPPGMYVRHTCDNPPCCNPAHLLLGTPMDNYNDMRSRGRERHAGASGVANGGCKLTASAVTELRILYATGQYRQIDLAARFGIKQSQVSRIVRGKSWLT